MIEDYQWIIESNRIEEVFDPLEDKRSIRAWNWCKDKPITVENILRLHKRIVCKFFNDKKLMRYAGKFRNCAVWVGGREGAHWPNVPSFVKHWVEVWAEGNQPLAKYQIQEAHVAFEKIHPFIDGNGRVGRMLMNWQRRKCGYEPLLIEASKRWDYYMWFK